MSFLGGPGSNAAWFSIQFGNVPAWNEPEIIGRLSTSLADAGFATQLADQTLAWREELSILRQCALTLLASNPSSASWTLALEYEIPRREKRIDAVLLTERVVLPIEFKIGAPNYARADIWQTQDYALDLRDFHEASFGLPIIPILVATNAPGQATKPAQEESSGVQCCNASTLTDVIVRLHQSVPSGQIGVIDPNAWLKSGYRPTPTIVEAARRVFAGHNVRELSHAYADNLGQTTEAIAQAIHDAKSGGLRILCFVTGVPGSGKTLTGLTAMQDARTIGLGAGASAFMSGNAPLVRVLREALIRDEASRGKTREEAERQAELLIQNVHRFIEEYGVRNPSAVPPEHVIAFDEAQRAWHADKLSKRHKNIGRSEPDLILEIMTRPEEWAVIVALVGGGQEIHDGEGGLEEWGRSIEGARYPWDIVVSPDVIRGGTSVAGHRLFGNGHGSASGVRTNPAMHLSVSVRSPKAQRLAEWVNAVISLDLAKAREALKSVQGFRILMTRSLSEARNWLRQSATGILRAGLLASSGALRLRAHGLELDADFHRGYPIERWFLDTRDDFRASHSLEVAMTEFECQGLELDYVGLCWGDDLTVLENRTEWNCAKPWGSKWRNIDGHNDRQYLLNKYRVLMTRAREGMVIWVPFGDDQDPTRPTAPLNRTYEFLRDAGVPEVASLADEN
jgi:hypothetical protein